MASGSQATRVAPAFASSARAAAYTGVSKLDVGRMTRTPSRRIRSSAGRNSGAAARRQNRADVGQLEPRRHRVGVGGDDLPRNPAMRSTLIAPTPAALPAPGPGKDFTVALARAHDVPPCASAADVPAGARSTADADRATPRRSPHADLRSPARGRSAPASCRSVRPRSRGGSCSARAPVSRAARAAPRARDPPPERRRAAAGRRAAGRPYPARPAARATRPASASRRRGCQAPRSAALIASATACAASSTWQSGSRVRPRPTIRRRLPELSEQRRAVNGGPSGPTESPNGTPQHRSP